MVNSQTINSSASDSLSLLAIWRTLRKRRLLILGVAVTVFSGVAIYTFTSTPIYESETLILVDNKVAVPVAATVESQVAISSLETEVQILKSRSLIESAVRKLEPPYNRTPPDMVAGGMAIGQIGEAGVLRVAYRDVDPARARAVLNVLGETYVKYSLSSKRSKATNAIKFIEEKLPVAKRELNKSARAIREFRRRYDIPDPDSYSATISGQQQGLVRQIQDLEILMAQTRTQYDELRRQVGEDPDTALATSILSQDVNYGKYVSQYKDTELEYTLQRARGFTDEAPTIKKLNVRRERLKKLMEAQAASILGKERASALSQKGETVTVLSSVVPSDGDKTNAPYRQSLKLGLAQQLLTTRLQMLTQNTQLAGLRKAEAEMTARFKTIPQLQQQYTELQRVFAQDSGTLDRLLSKVDELRIAAAQETSPWRVLEPPFLPTTPVAPKVNQNLLYGFVASIFLGLGAAFVPDLLDERVKGVEEAKELTGLPLLGAIPKVENLTEAINAGSGEMVVDDRLVARQYSRSPFKESLRSLALSLRYLGSNNSVKTLLITSSIPAEGKSVITYTLGLVLAEFGRRVLIVDADMRKPSLHRLMETANARGLSTAIATDTPWQELLQPSSHPNLSLLTSGPIPPNPVALLDSERMSELVEEWRQTYDYVLIDTPPIIGLPDAQSMTSRVDRVVLVVAVERSTRSILARVSELLRGCQCSLAGVVVNMLNDGNDGYYYQYYNSYYGEPTETNTQSAPRRAREMLSGLFKGGRSNRRS